MPSPSLYACFQDEAYLQGAVRLGLVLDAVNTSLPLHREVDTPFDASSSWDLNIYYKVINKNSLFVIVWLLHYSDVQYVLTTLFNKHCSVLWEFVLNKTELNYVSLTPFSVQKVRYFAW